MNPLTNKKVELYLLDRPVAKVINDPKHPHENIMMRDTTLAFSLPAEDGKWLDIFAKEAGSYKAGRELQKFLEETAGLPANSMQMSDPYKMDFWKEHGTVEIRKNFPGISSAVAVFDLSNPIDYVKYLVCKYNRERVAPSWNERGNKQYYICALRDPEHENNEEKTKTSISSDIIDNLLKLRKAGDRVMLYTIYNLFINAGTSYFPEHRITNKSSVDDIYTALFEVAANKHLGHITALNRIVSKSDVELNGYRLVYEGIMYGIFVVTMSGKRKSYYTPDHELIAHTEAEVVNWLNSPKGSEYKLIIESKRDSVPEVTKTKRK